MKWVLQRLRLLFEVVHSPEIAFCRELTGPSFLVPLCILGLLSAGIAAIQFPLQVEWMRFQMESAGASATQAAASLELVRRSGGLSIALAPVLLFLRWLLLAYMIWLMAGLFVIMLDYSKILTIVAYSYLPILVRDAVILLVLFLRGDQALHQPEGLNVPIGANLILPWLQLPWSALAANVNVFEVWLVSLLVIGISKAAGSRCSRALAIVLPAWGIAVLSQLAFVSLGLAVKKSF